MARVNAITQRLQVAQRAAQGNQVVLSAPIDGAYLAAVAAVHVTTAGAGSGAVSCWGEGVKAIEPGAATDGKGSTLQRNGSICTASGRCEASAAGPHD